MHMHKSIAIVAVAIAAVAGVTVYTSAPAPEAARGEVLMPSIGQMMSDARVLPTTPFVAP
jgi:hypothetical protein